MTTADNAIYDAIGSGYAKNRIADRRWAQQIHEALGAARSVLNVGAGSGSYEPDDLRVVALEPSRKMIVQRPMGSAPVVQGVAEDLPFRDGAFDAGLAILTTHHWLDPERGLAELCRVSHRQVVVTWDPDWFATRFWLIRDYLPQVGELERTLPTLDAVTEFCAARSLQLDVQPLLVPADCTDGFFGGYWRRPQAYLDADIRASMSGLALLDEDIVERAMQALRTDLETGAWQRRYSDVVQLMQADLGYRLLQISS